ncbi:MAG TPA: hypothetical protein VHZ76_01905 [Gammaproteobacteria bacterium]|jgi:hypothetical protein|nr:hypothetical protein [Gammaproteobacteria bacterium]
MPALYLSGPAPLLHRAIENLLNPSILRQRASIIDTYFSPHRTTLISKGKSREEKKEIWTSLINMINNLPFGVMVSSPAFCEAIEAWEKQPSGFKSKETGKELTNAEILADHQSIFRSKKTGRLIFNIFASKPKPSGEGRAAGIGEEGVLTDSDKELRRIKWALYNMVTNAPAPSVAEEEVTETFTDESNVVKYSVDFIRIAEANDGEQPRMGMR